MKFSIEPILYTVRGYSDDIDDNVLSRSNFELVCTLSICGNVGTVTGLIGNVNIKAFRSFLSEIEKLGINTLIYERRKSNSKTVLIKL